MMITKIFAGLFFYCFLTFALATTSMSGITITGYFDEDEYLDQLICGDPVTSEGDESISYRCEIKLKTKNKKWLIHNNNDCTDFSIKAGDKNGEIIIECGLYGEIKTLYYKYNNKFFNWFLYGIFVESFPMSNNSLDVSSDVTIELKPLLSIDQPLLAISSEINLSLLNKIIKQKYDEKKYNDICAIAKIINLDISNLSSKTVKNYNDLAFYYEQSGCYDKSISILTKIIEEYPNRTVAYLNLGDAYWSVQDRRNAKKFYKDYIAKMQVKDKLDKVPNRVLERIQ